MTLVKAGAELNAVFDDEKGGQLTAVDACGRVGEMCAELLPQLRAAGGKRLDELQEGGGQQPSEREL